VDPEEWRWMLAELRSGDLAVDVGAHKGAYTYAMRRAVGRSGAVVAFEPQPELAAYLRRCAEDFRWSNVAIVERALSGEPGRRRLWRPADEPSPAASLDGTSLRPGAVACEVEVDTLDRALAELHQGGRVRFVKCDVEGHELEVFRGGNEVLSGHRPRVLMECETRHAPDRAVQDVFAHLEALGYRGSFFLGGERLGVACFDASRHQVEGRRPYVNNFVFEPAE
jgi:FkbM family methyltransferase